MSVEDRIRQSSETFCKHVNMDLAAQLENFVVELVRAVDQEHSVAVAEATARHASELTAALADAERTLAQQVALTREEAERAAEERLSAQSAALRAEIERLTADLQQAREAAEREVSAQVAELRAEVERLTGDQQAREVVEREVSAQVAELRAEVERLTADQQARQSAEHAASAEVAQLRADAERLTADLQQAHRASADAQRSLETERAQATFERDRAVESSVIAALSDERQSQMQLVERLLGTLRRLDEGRSLTEILDALVEGAAAEAPRVALMSVQGPRVRSWKLMGFDPLPAPIDLDRASAGVVTRALEQGDVAFTEPAAPGQAVPPGPGFTALPADRSGLAIPIRVGGAAVAVLYADDVTDAAAAKPAAWPEALEILTRHASMRLENLTAVRTAQAIGARVATAPAPVSGASIVGEDEAGGAHRYARLLISEIKLYNEAAVRVGREKRDLVERLRDEIDRARRLYEERVPAVVRAAHAFFDEELVRTLAGGDAALLGRRSDALA
jgi:chemotaxis protein histidine kinase CheA